MRRELRPRRGRDRRVPALLVSGFLGSGKTTLVRHLLRDAQARGLRLAIVSNEFGEVGIDRALLGGGDETFVELGARDGEMVEVKSGLVAAIFMHLKYDWGKVFCIMIPVVVMSMMMIIVLLPDAVLGWHN